MQLPLSSAAPLSGMASMQQQEMAGSSPAMTLPPLSFFTAEAWFKPSDPRCGCLAVDRLKAHQQVEDQLTKALAWQRAGESLLVGEMLASVLIGGVAPPPLGDAVPPPPPVPPEVPVGRQLSCRIGLGRLLDLNMGMREWQPWIGAG
jgi:hypothetical protein